MNDTLQDPPLAGWAGVEDFKAAVYKWASEIRVHPKAVRVQTMRKKWASCGTSGIVTFNRDLLGLERGIGEAAIIHELVHLLVPNHGKLFRGLVHAYTQGRLPDLGDQIDSQTRRQGRVGINAERAGEKRT